jgi:hypothetical protein
MVTGSWLPFVCGQERKVKGKREKVKEEEKVESRVALSPLAFSL